MTPHWSELREALQEWLLANPRILIGCDFDGTLSPLVPHADDARLPEGTRAVLQRLRSLKGVTLAFISGRSLADLQQRMDVAGALYAGNHGLEMTGAGGAPVLAPGAEDGVHTLRSVQRTLAPLITHMPGVWIEDKRLTLSVHYRLADDSLHEEIEHAVRMAVTDALPLLVRPAKCIWEIRPVIEWDKGTALSQFMHRQQVPASATAYMGDDVTDCDAFRVLPDGWTFFVGEGAGSAARATLRNAQDCAALLGWMADVRASMKP